MQFRPHLLVTDDDRAFRETLRMGLVARGFEVSVAGDGQEALEIVVSSEVHLVLLDHHMPRLTGLETIRRLRQRPELGALHTGFGGVGSRFAITGRHFVHLYAFAQTDQLSGRRPVGPCGIDGPLSVVAGKLMRLNYRWLPACLPPAQALPWAPIV